MPDTHNPHAAPSAASPPAASLTDPLAAGGVISEPTPDEWRRAATAAYEAELIRRYELGLHLSKIDTRDARKLIAARDKK